MRCISCDSPDFRVLGNGVIVLIIGIFAYIGARELDKETKVKEREAKHKAEIENKKSSIMKQQSNPEYKCHYDDYSDEPVCVKLG